MFILLPSEVLYLPLKILPLPLSMINLLNSSKQIRPTRDDYCFPLLTPTVIFSAQVQFTIYLEGEFLGLAVVAVLLQVADGEFFQRKSPLHRKQ